MRRHSPSLSGRPGLRRLAVVVAALAATTVGASGARASELVVDVTFNANHTITAALPDGTPFGTTSGPPTVVPAGYYSFELTNPSGVAGPQFDLQGPGVSVVDNMFEGEEASATDTADLLPSSTYTWRDDANPGVVYTVMTSSQIEGTPSGYLSGGSSGTETTSGGSSPGGTSTSSTTSSSGVVGTAVAPLRGTLTGRVSAAGKLTLSFKGKPVTSLTSGRYTIAVTDQSRTSGFTVQETNRAAIAVTGIAFVGKRSTTVDLTPGQWFYYPTFVGKKTYFIVIS